VTLIGGSAWTPATDSVNEGRIERDWGRLGGTRWTRVPWQSSRRLYREGRCRPHRRDGGSGRDASVLGTLSWARILALRLPVDAVEIRTTSWRSTGSRRWSSMAASKVAHGVAVASRCRAPGGRRRWWSSPSILKKKRIGTLPGLGWLQGRATGPARWAALGKSILHFFLFRFPFLFLNSLCWFEFQFWFQICFYRF
jgi:hypothetical protein